jgi:uncharacterized protein (TIGR02231 family)
MHRLPIAPLAVALVLCVAPLARAQDERVIASDIDAVTVYEDRALVTRTASLDLAAGTSRVVIEHLPAGLDGPSLRARCRGAQVLGVETEVVHLEKENSEALLAAKDALVAAQRRLRDTEAELEDAGQRWHVLQTIQAKAADDASRDLGQGTGPDVKSIEKLLDFVEQRTKKAREDMASAETKVDAAKEAMNAAARRVAELQGAGARVEQRAFVTLRATAEGSSALELSYLIHGAGWRPVYALRVDADFGTALLELGAEVQQRTGENWGDVNLELTTARPSAGAAPPEPDPWRIGLPQPEADRGMVAPAARAPRKAARFADEMDDAPEMEERMLELAVVRSGLVVAFAAHRRETVRSGARPARVSLGSFELEPEVVWTVFPRETADVFVQAKVKNTVGSPLPSGEARVFVGPDYVGPMHLADWAMEEELRVGLGVDRQVTAEREDLERGRETEGLFSKETVHTRRYRITVKNHRSRDITARIVDQIPVSGDEDLTVKITESNLPQAALPEREAETNKARGVLVWRQPVTAGAELDLRFAFEIRHPKDEIPWGLE